MPITSVKRASRPQYVKRSPSFNLKTTELSTWAKDLNTELTREGIQMTDKHGVSICE